MERAILLVKQGYMLFPHSTTKKHFKYNSGLLSMMQFKYSKAVKKYFELYYHIAKDLKPKARSTQADQSQLEKFAILNNLIIACMLKESVKVDVAGMDQLYEILRYENVIDVRFTQIQEELTLFLLVAYFKQYYTYKKRV